VAGEAFVGENGPHIAIEVHRFLGGMARYRSQQRKDTTNSQIVPLHGYSFDYI